MEVQQPSGLCHEQLAGDGEARAAAVPLDERPADGGLEAAYVLAHRALAQVEGGGRPLEPAAVRDGDQASQRSDVEYGSHVDQSSRQIHERW